MKISLFLSLLTASWLLAADLAVTQGSVKAHTEVFGDSTIDPSTSDITSHLSIVDGVESITGSISASMLALRSDNKDRDKHMVKAIESTTYPVATYTFENIVKTDAGYTINGKMRFHGITKPLDVAAKFEEQGKTLRLTGTSAFAMSEYDVEPPTLLFLTVRDQIDLDLDITFERQ